MAKQSRSSESQLPIPPNNLILDEILPRLPVKSLIRFKSVSKHWFSIISSEEFAKIGLKFFPNCNQGFILWKLVGFATSYCNFLSFDECLNVKEFVKLDSKYPSLNIVPKHSKVVGSCDGLVCLYDKLRCFHLWNPATNQCRNAHCPDDVAPPSRRRVRVVGLIAPYRIDGRKRYQVRNYFVGYGFGHVRSIDDYRIACLWICWKGLCHVYVFSLRARTWEEVATFDDNFYVRLGGSTGLVIGDSMYWPPVIRTNHDNYMVVLDLVRGELKKIPLMDFGVSYDDCVKVFLMKGCLSLCCLNYINGGRDLRVCDVWRLKQLDDWSSWEKVFSFEDRHGGLPFHLFETGECLVRRARDQLILHCPSQAALEKYGEGNLICQGSKEERYFRSFDGAWVYVESLISPFGTPEMMPRVENE